MYTFTHVAIIQISYRIYPSPWRVLSNLFLVYTLFSPPKGTTYSLLTPLSSFTTFCTIYLSIHPSIYSIICVWLLSSMAFIYVILSVSVVCFFHCWIVFHCTLYHRLFMYFFLLDMWAVSGLGILWISCNDTSHMRLLCMFIYVSIYYGKMLCNGIVDQVVDVLFFN